MEFCRQKQFTRGVTTLAHRLPPINADQNSIHKTLPVSWDCFSHLRSTESGLMNDYRSLSSRLIDVHFVLTASSACFVVRLTLTHWSLTITRTVYLLFWWVSSKKIARSCSKKFSSLFQQESSDRCLFARNEMNLGTLHSYFSEVSLLGIDQWWETWTFPRTWCLSR